MFHEIPSAIARRMRFLEELDARDRVDGSPRQKRLRQIPPETGRFIALMAASGPDGAYIEIGASGGYSALWLALACREIGRRLITYEVAPDKVALAAETITVSGVTDVVELVEGDARVHLPHQREIAFCFLDAEKEIYLECYEMVVPKLVAGGLLLADNAMNHERTLRPMLDRALSDSRVDATIVPVGKGVLACRKRRQSIP